MVENQQLTTAEEYVSRGYKYKSDNKKEQALQDFNQAIFLNPDHLNAYDFRGNIYLEKGEYDLAIADFNKMVQLNPDKARGYFNLGNVYLNKGEVDQAIELFTKAIEINPNDAIVYVSRGVLYDHKCKFDLSIADYETALKLDPSLTDAKNLLNDLKKRMEDWQVIEKIREYAKRCQGYNFQKNFDQVILETSEAIKLYPDAPNIIIMYCFRGIAYFDGKNDYNRAKEDFEAILCIDPTLPQASIARQYLEKIK